MLDYEFLFIVSIPIFIILTIIFIKKRIWIKKIIQYSIFYFYIISILAITIFPIPIQWLKEIWIYNENINNFIPFNSIIDILSNNNLDIKIKIKQIIGNIVIFIPIGLFISFICKINFKKILLIGISFSFSIEITQYMISLLLWFSYRVSDIDDMLLNTLGFVIGFYVHKLFIWWTHKE